MKKVMMIVGLSAAAFMAGSLVSCNVVDDKAPDSVPPVLTGPPSSYVTPTK